MTRTTFYKAQYFATILGVGSIALLILIRYRFSAISILLTLFLLMVPGRILGFYWRNLLRGLRLLNARQFEESRRHSELFLEELRQRPYLKYFVWLGSSTYSRNPKVLALNNLGAAESGLGRFDAAKSHLEMAIDIDPKCPLPFFNMGIIHAKAGELEKATRHFEEAARLGYTNSLSDKIVRGSQNRFARTSGTGASGSI